MSPRFKKFLLVGGVCTAVDFVFFALFFYTLGWHVVVANLASYSIGIVLSFFLNRAWTFSDSESRSKKRIVFSFFFGYLGLLLNTAIVALFSQLVHEMLAKCIGVLVIIFFNYFTQKRFVFKL